MTKDHEHSYAEGRSVALQVILGLTASKIENMCLGCFSLGAGTFFLQQFIAQLSDDEAKEFLESFIEKLMNEKEAGEGTPASYSGERLN